jgi:hypothetical protein
MAQPFSYMLNVPNPAEAVTGGLQQGVQLASMMERADLLAAQRRQTDLENAALRAKAQMLKDQQDAVKAFYETPSEKRTAADYERLTATLPKEQADNIRAGFEAKTKEQQKQELLFGGQVFSALRSGDRETANTLLRQRADASRNAGDEANAKAYENAAEMAAISPEQAELFVGTTLSALPGGKEFINSVAAQSEMRTSEAMAPGKIAKAIAEGKIAEVKAQYQEQVEKAEIALKGAQTTSAKAAAGASYASAKKSLAEVDRIREMTPAERDRVVAQTEKLRAEARAKSGEAGAQGTIEAGQRVLDTVARIKELGSKPAFGGGLIGKAAEKTGFAANVFDQIAGPAAGRSPTFSTQAQDVESLIETLKAQQFLTQIKQMQGMGALSNSEGEKLTASVANLSLTQSPQQLQKNIQYIEDTTKKGMEKAQRMMGGAGGGAGAAPPSNIFDAANAILGEE